MAPVNRGIDGDPPQAPAQREPGQYSGFVVVRLKPGLSPPVGGESLLEYAREAKLDRLTTALAQFGAARTARSARTLSPQRILELERKGTSPDFRPRHSLNSYWRIDMREGPDRVDELIDRLSALPEVDAVYRELSVTDPSVDPSDDTFASMQGYLDPAPVGIDARWAWTQPGGAGALVGFVDLEQGWLPSHEDLPGLNPIVIHGDNRHGVGGYAGDHGTASVGVVAGVDNQTGIVGIAPNVASVRMASHYCAQSGDPLHVAEAIYAAIGVMSQGDVLLLEVQRGLLPTEIDEADFDAIQLAAFGFGVIVVEAAGNGDFDIDGIVGTIDSGAILVGAATADPAHNRWRIPPLNRGSCFGNRVDCFGWGELIVTSGFGDLDNGGGDSRKSYTNTYNGTSGAAAIVAGAAVVVQGMRKASGALPLTSTQMRKVLKAQGTKQGAAVPGAIGVMPNLPAAVAAMRTIPTAPTNLRIVS